MARSLETTPLQLYNCTNRNCSRRYLSRCRLVASQPNRKRWRGMRNAGTILVDLSRDCGESSIVSGHCWESSHRISPLACRARGTGPFSSLYVDHRQKGTSAKYIYMAEKIICWTKNFRQLLNSCAACRQRQT